MSGPSQPLTPQVGQRVHVDVSGMQTAGGVVQAGTIVVGTVTHIGPEQRLTIRLDAAVGGALLITAPLGRIRTII
jgi:phage protein D